MSIKERLIKHHNVFKYNGKKRKKNSFWKKNFLKHSFLGDKFVFQNVKQILDFVQSSYNKFPLHGENSKLSVPPWEHVFLSKVLSFS